MKKLICFALVAVMVLLLAACGGTDDNGTKSGGDGNTAGVKSGDESNVSAAFPLTYTPKWSTEFVKSEGNPDGTLSLGYGNIAYDPNEEIVLEYCKSENELYTAINGSSDWPAELNEEWKGYGYVAIETKNDASIRTLAVGKYGEKQALVIRQHEDALDKTGFRSADEINRTPEEEGTRYVEYCMLQTEGEATIEQIASAAYEALYLQAWSLIPADKQGVQISANGKTYTVSDILKEMAD